MKSERLYSSFYHKKTNSCYYYLITLIIHLMSPFCIFVLIGWAERDLLFSSSNLPVLSLYLHPNNHLGAGSLEPGAASLLVGTCFPPHAAWTFPSSASVCFCICCLFVFTLVCNSCLAAPLQMP